MIHALARGGSVLDEPRYVARPPGGHFLLAQLQAPDGRLLHTWRAAGPSSTLYLDDYACLANALIALYEADFDERGSSQAVAWPMMLPNSPIERGGFFFTADDHETLLPVTRMYKTVRLPAQRDGSHGARTPRQADGPQRLPDRCGRNADFICGFDGAASDGRWADAVGDTTFTWVPRPNWCCSPARARRSVQPFSMNCIGATGPTS